MSKKILNIFIISVISLIIVSAAASLLALAASSYTEHKKLSSPENNNPAPAASYVEMIVCVSRVEYYKDNTLSGNPIGFKVFGDKVYAEQNSTGISRIYNQTGALLGYCKSVSLMNSSVKLFVEVPYAWNSEGQISRLVDVRKYAEIFDARIIYSDDEPILIQYDTMIKLFEVADKFYSELGYTLVIEKAYIPQSKISEECCLVCSHASGASLTLKMLKKGASKTEAIPYYEHEGLDSSPVSAFTKLLEDYSLIHDESSDCFYDADYTAYMITDYDLSSPVYYIRK
ncbi:MAG: hypothetical protein E7633_02430 [Ruminococcaceae bacterium]|nr:hypothetical protein [Oscillospiraceae bacterium]